MKILAGLLVALVTLQLTCAAEIQSADPWENGSQNFEKSAKEVSIGAGFFFSPFIMKKRRPTENFAGPLAQIGCMLNSANSQASWSGNFEVSGELFGGAIVKGEGDYVGNATVWLRYNLLTPYWRVVPYLQIGAGVTLTDADQDAFGQTFNFNEGAAVGLRFFIQPRCSLNAEFRCLHISNAGMSERNLGINAQGGAMSVSWYF